MPFVLNAVPLNTNPSCAGSNYLTARKFCQPSLLRVVGERAMGARTTRAGASQVIPESTNVTVEARDDKPDAMLDEMDIFAEPASSDEDEKIFKMPASDSPATTVARRPKFSPPKPISSPISKATKKDQFTMPDLFDPDEFASSQPKKKRKVEMYDKRNTRTPQNMIEPNSKAGFVRPTDLPDEREEESPDTQFKVPAPVFGRGPRPNRNTSKTTAFQPPSEEPLAQPLAEPASTGPKFKMPDPLAAPDSSATSMADSIFEVTEHSPEAKRQRSGSTSSLSSHSSAEIGMGLEQQKGLAHDDSGDGLEGIRTTRCRLCSARVELSLYEEFVSNHRKMNFRQQQEFHQLHQQRQAERTWKDRRYPNIDWSTFELDRVPIFIPHLIKVLRRKAPSFYRTKLDSVVRDAKASRKATNRYVKDGIVDLAKQGYYGPRGARIMGHAITNAMLKELEAELLRDKVVRAVGVGGYVSCVLVPDLMVELVKEDMNLLDNDEAMKVLDESTDVGALLNGDDDEVVNRDGSVDI